MADSPQGIFRFAGVKALFGATFTLQRGVSPSVCTMEVAPISGVLRAGSLLIEYGGQRFSFRDCVVDKIEAGVDDSGFATWRLTILDRRWKWRGLGAVSGQFNRSRWNDEDPSTFDLREILRICFNALNESNVDMSAVPYGEYPEVDWDYERPADAIEEVLSEYGLTVVLGTDDRIRIVEDGKGQSLPRNAQLLSYTETFNPAEAPDSIRAYAEPTRYQIDAILEPVGQDLTGAIRPIEELSYKPTDGGLVPPSSSWSIIGAGKHSAWLYTDAHYFANVAEGKARELARATVFRWYRIRVPFRLPGRNEQIDELRQILPVDTLQVEHEPWVRFDGTEEENASWMPRKPAAVYGIFSSGKDGGKSYYTTDERNLADKPLAQYQGSFSIDVDEGIVKFSQPVYQLTVDDSLPGGRICEPAWLRLRTGCNARDKDYGIIDRHYLDRRTPGPRLGTPPEYFLGDKTSLEYFWKFTGEYGSFELKDNKKDVDKYLNNALDRKIISYAAATEKPASATYVGFVPISPDGAILNVTWTIEGDGSATTRAAVMMDQLLYIPSEKELKMQRQFAKAEGKRATARMERERLRRTRR